VVPYSYLKTLYAGGMGWDAIYWHVWAACTVLRADTVIMSALEVDRYTIEGDGFLIRAISHQYQSYEPYQQHSSDNSNSSNEGKESTTGGNSCGGDSDDGDGGGRGAGGGAGGGGAGKPPLPPGGGGSKKESSNSKLQQQLQQQNTLQLQQNAQTNAQQNAQQSNLFPFSLMTVDAAVQCTKQAYVNNGIVLFKLLISSPLSGSLPHTGTSISSLNPSPGGTNKRDIRLGVWSN
jgi:hypothetical protein